MKKQRQTNQNKSTGKKKLSLKNILLNHIPAIIMFVVFWFSIYWINGINHTLETTEPIKYECIDIEVRTRNGRSKIIIKYNGEVRDASITTKEAIAANSKLPDIYYYGKFDYLFSEAYQKDFQRVGPILFACLFVILLAIPYLPPNRKKRKN